MNTTVTWAIAMLLEAPWSLRAWTLACRWWGSRTRRGPSWFDDVWGGDYSWQSIHQTLGSWVQNLLFCTYLLLLRRVVSFCWNEWNWRAVFVEFTCLWGGACDTWDRSAYSAVSLYPIFSQRRCSGDFRWHHLSSIALRKWNLVSSRQFMSSSTIINHIKSLNHIRSMIKSISIITIINHLLLTIIKSMKGWQTSHRWFSRNHLNESWKQMGRCPSMQAGRGRSCAGWRGLGWDMMGIRWEYSGSTNPNEYACINGIKWI